MEQGRAGVLATDPRLQTRPTNRSRPRPPTMNMTRARTGRTEVLLPRALNPAVLDMVIRHHVQATLARTGEWPATIRRDPGSEHSPGACLASHLHHHPRPATQLTREHTDLIPGLTTVQKSFGSPTPVLRSGTCDSQR